ncbi:MAG: hypothetical protein LUG85_05335 [Clostridiales bacterium]|nr:hypothetical protein [Clostridiales bacterium]MCD7827939.1 hypothetical protein [Clostridiales bacterium]
MKKKNGKSNIGTAGIVCIALGVGIVAVCLFPSKWMVVIVSAALIAAGVMLIKR